MPPTWFEPKIPQYQSTRAFVHQLTEIFLFPSFPSIELSFHFPFWYQIIVQLLSERMGMNVGLGFPISSFYQKQDPRRTSLAAGSYWREILQVLLGNNNVWVVTGDGLCIKEFTLSSKCCYDWWCLWKVLAREDDKRSIAWLTQCIWGKYARILDWASLCRS